MKRLLQAYQCPDLAAARAVLRQWYRLPLGKAWQAVEQDLLNQVLVDCFGYHLLQIGRPCDEDLCAGSRIHHRIAMVQAGDAVDGAVGLCAEGGELPLASGSVDVVVLPHTLSYAALPHALLREVERVLIPEGYVVILGFNPWSLFGLRRLFAGWRGRSPWCGHFYSSLRLRDWLSLLGFDSLQLRHYFYRPPLASPALLQRLGWLERWGGRCWPILGGGFMLVARKRVTTLTPIRPRWRSRRLIQVGSAEPTVRRNRT
ncbi:MAG: methyltransferase domain-containing protein [Thiohalomonadaceae bacterium]